MTTLKSNNSNLPIELINLIMSYMSSPVAIIFKKDLKVIEINDYLNEIIVDEDGEEYLSVDEESFALCFFFNRYLGDTTTTKKSKYHEIDVEEHFSNSKIYNYSNMDSDYVDTLNEYHKNH